MLMLLTLKTFEIHVLPEHACTETDILIDHTSTIYLNFLLWFTVEYTRNTERNWADLGFYLWSQRHVHIALFPSITILFHFLVPPIKTCQGTIV